MSAEAQRKRVSNETTNTDVFFDNLQVTHVRGPLAEETHYYPFGLTMAGISGKALTFGKVTNRFKFNGGSELSEKEFSDGSGLDLYETPFRGYDAQLGRFCQVDAMADYYTNWSPYNFSLNSPILFSDPTGLDPERGLTPETAKELGGVTVHGTPKNNYKYTDWIRFYDANRKHDRFALENYLVKHGVNDNGIRLFQQASNPDNVKYRDAKESIDHAAWKFEEEIASEIAAYLVGAGVFKGIKWGYRGYKIYKASRMVNRMAGKTLKELQRLVGGENASRLRQLFGANEKGAKAVLEDLPNTKVPEGLTRETMQAYRELINRVPDPRGVQELRGKILDYILLP